MSGKNPFCCSGGSQQLWVLQVRGVLSVSHAVAFAHLISFGPAPSGWERGWWFL